MAGQQFDTVLVNLCYLSSDFENSLKTYFKDLKSEPISYGFLDTTGILESHAKYNEGLLKLYGFDSNSKARSVAADKFINYTSKLSDFKFSDSKHIRDFKLNGFSIYWLTDIAEKHPLHHILFNIFYFEELFSVILKQVNFKHIKFLLPPDRFHYRESLKNYFSIKYADISFEGISPTTYLPTVRQAISFVRQKYREHVLFLRNFKKQKFEFLRDYSFKNIILTYLGSTWMQDQKVDFVLGGIKSITGPNTVYVPLIYNWQNIPKWSEEWDVRYIKAIPGKMDWIIFLLKHFLAVRKIRRIKNDHRLLNNGPVSPYALKIELLLSLEYKFFMWKNHLWLSNYFKKVKGCNIFYQDEFYSFGRLISNALNNKSENRGIGFQHGMIREDHSVYALTEVEMSGKNPMPSPKYFVVWGKYFQDLICKRAESMRKKIVIAANPNLFESKEAKLDRQVKNGIKVKYDLLWCSGIRPELTEEFTLVKNYLRNRKSKTLLVRMHPIHDLNIEITEGLKEIGFSNFIFSTEAELKNDVMSAEVILSSSASTVVLEAIALGKKVVGINFGRYVPIEIDNPNYIIVSSNDGLSNAIENGFVQLKGAVTEQAANEIFSHDFTKWKEILI